MNSTIALTLAVTEAVTTAAETTGGAASSSSGNLFTNILYFILAILIFGVLIMIHELGHYTAARIFKVAIKEFSIGMGPKIVSHTSKKSGIAYSLRLFPIGGFVSMVGEDEDSDNPNALTKKAAWKQLIIMASGALMNILLGVIIMFMLVACALPIGGTTVKEIDAEYADVYGQQLMLDDTIIYVGKTRVHFYQELSYEIMNQGYEQVDLTVIRNGEKIVIEDVSFPTVEDSGVVFGEMFFKVGRLQKNFGNVVSYSFYSSFSTIKMIWESLINLITGRYSLSAVSGPVGAMTAVADTAKTGVVSLLYLCVFISMNLGVFNLLPLPALDGGRILFVLIKMVRGGKPINRKYEAYVHFVGIILLLLLMVVITFKDILQLF